MKQTDKFQKTILYITLRKYVSQILSAQRKQEQCCKIQTRYLNFPYVNILLHYNVAFSKSQQAKRSYWSSFNPEHIHTCPHAYKHVSWDPYANFVGFNLINIAISQNNCYHFLQKLLKQNVMNQNLERLFKSKTRVHGIIRQ